MSNVFKKKCHPYFFSGSIEQITEIRVSTHSAGSGAFVLHLEQTIPIYDSGIRKTQVQRERLNLINSDYGAEQLKESSNYKIHKATIISRVNQTLDVQQRNVDLATEVLRFQYWHKAGVGSNIEVINASKSQRSSD
jgi:outer membrane protein TolC